MKELWIEIPNTTPDETKKTILHLATEANAVLIEGEHAIRQQDKQEILLTTELDQKRIGALQNEHKKIALRIDIAGKEDENKAVEAAEQGINYIIIDCQDWRIIPLENLIARTRGKSKLIARVNSAEDARLVLQTQRGEIGADHRLDFGQTPVVLQRLDQRAAVTGGRGQPVLRQAGALAQALQQITEGGRVSRRFIHQIVSPYDLDCILFVSF